MDKTEERTYADRLAQMRWPDGFTCACSSSKHYRLRKRPRVFVCRECGKQTSVTAGTLLHGTRLPLSAWFLAAALMTRAQGVTAAELERQLDVHYETAWQLLHRLRQGLDRTRERELRGTAQIGRTFITFRPPMRPAGGRLGHSAWILVDERGWFAIDTKQPPFPYWERRSRGLHCRVPIGQRRLLHGPVADLARALRHRWMRIHFAISQRWVDRYSWEFEATKGPAPVDATQVVERALSQPKQTFDALRPQWHPPVRPGVRPRRRTREGAAPGW
jgi:transposase-like protein